jgi:hypothetical protein|tara:strand:+ start:1428 stop:1661 length:234 start_codon:yes stop_codon:yes gene_type:complete
MQQQSQTPINTPSMTSQTPVTQEKTDKEEKLEKEKKPKNAWQLHVDEYRKQNPEVSFKDALKLAAATYTKKVVNKKV